MKQYRAFGKARSPNLFASLDSRIWRPLCLSRKQMDIRVSATFPKGQSPRSSSLLSIYWLEYSLAWNSSASYLLRKLLRRQWIERCHLCRRPSRSRCLALQPLTPSTPPKAKDPKPGGTHRSFHLYRGACNADVFPIRAVERKEAGSYQLSNYYHRPFPSFSPCALKTERALGPPSTVLALKLATIRKRKSPPTNRTSSLRKPNSRGRGRTPRCHGRRLDAELTLDEAKAMVATWDYLWFTDPDRVLAILPQSSLTKWCHSISLRNPPKSNASLLPVLNSKSRPRTDPHQDSHPL